jgi:penicillin-binding protein 1A
MKKVYADKSIDINKGPFPAPSNLTTELDCSRYYGAQRDTIPASQKMAQPTTNDLNKEDI